MQQLKQEVAKDQVFKSGRVSIMRGDLAEDARLSTNDDVIVRSTGRQHNLHEGNYTISPTFNLLNTEILAKLPDDTSLLNTESQHGQYVQPDLQASYMD